MTAASKTNSVKHQRGHLSRLVIAQAGLQVAYKEGVGNLTMKRLASELSVTPMAIYRHFDDKSDLIDAVLDLYVQEQDICNHAVPELNWSAWLFETYSNMYRGLQSMPSVYPYLSSASRFGPGATETVERTLSVLQKAGFSLVRATQAANVLNGFVIGCAIMDNAFYQDLMKSKQERDSRQESVEGLQSLTTGLDLIIASLKHEHSDFTANK